MNKNLNGVTNVRSLNMNLSSLNCNKAKTKKVWVVKNQASTRPADKPAQDPIVDKDGSISPL